MLAYLHLLRGYLLLQRGAPYIDKMAQNVSSQRQKRAKPVSAAVFEAFYRDHGHRVRAYARVFAHKFRAPKSLLADLEQAAYLEASLALRYWSPTGGKSVFNWCAGPMLRGMKRCLRASQGAKAYGCDNVPHERQLFDHHAAQSAPPMADYIDLRTVLAADPKPSHIVRFIMAALSPAGGADAAAAEGVCRQAVCITNGETRTRLRQALSA